MSEAHRRQRPSDLLKLVGRLGDDEAAAAVPPAAAGEGAPTNQAESGRRWRARLSVANTSCCGPQDCGTRGIITSATQSSSLFQQ